MKTWIAFLRGINVGGKNRLPMKDLTTRLEALGLVDVRTYIQSGNVIFRSRDAKPQDLARRIAQAIEKDHGFLPAVMVLSANELRAAADKCPFQGGEALNKTLHLFFLASEPDTPDFGRMDGLRTNSETYVLKDRVLYFHTPDGFGKSRLAQRIEPILGVDATARNWRTVNAVLELVER